MPSAPLDLNGTQIKLYYTDTGPVDSPDYTTLVVYHGTMFTSHTFNKLLPLAPSSNIRLVNVTRRDYDSLDESDSPGSTPHTESEVEDFKAGREIALERTGLETAKFLLWFADTQKIPKISNDGKKGGISVMGWSLGIIGALSLLGHPDVIPKESQQKLALYFRQFIMYNPAESLMGYNFGMDYGIYPPAEKFLEDMPLWASSYYVHQDLTSNAGALATTVDSSRPPSTKNMTEKEFAVNYTPYASVNVDIPLFTAMYALHDKQFKAALFNGALAKRFLPALQIVCIGSSHGLFGNERARFLMEREFEEHARQKHEVRPVRVINIEGANHLVHWDEPKKFWDVTVDILFN